MKPQSVGRLAAKQESVEFITKHHKDGRISIPKDVVKLFDLHADDMVRVRIEVVKRVKR